MDVINSKKKMAVLKKMYSSIAVVDVEVFDIAVSIYIKLKKLGKIIGDSDIYIAAYCVKNNLILVTNNTKHFENIEGLQIENRV